MSSPARIRIEAPAKVNLRLVVLAREVSGFHSLETLFCGVSLADVVEVERSGEGLHLEPVAGEIATGPPEDNLVVRAARAYYQRLGDEPRVRLRLEKRIPSAAGLGGGSSDAAATLRALNALHSRALSDADLLECAAALGSDVPFFLAPGPFAIAWSRGERMLCLRPPSTRWVVIVHPGVDVPTLTAFAKLAAWRDAKAGNSATEPLAIGARDLRRWDELDSLAVNDFETVAPELVPRFDEIRSALLAEGAGIVLLSGSGGAIFGLFARKAIGSAAARRLRETGYRTWLAHTLRQWPEPALSGGVPGPSRSGPG